MGRPTRLWFSAGASEGKRPSLMRPSQAETLTPDTGDRQMTLDTMKKHFFDEATELGLASESDIERLCNWLELNGYDSDLAYSMWESAAEEISYMMAELA